MKKAVLFDLDDTLIAEEDFIKSGYQTVAQLLAGRYGLLREDLYDELLALYKADAKNVFNRILDAHGIPYTKEEILGLVSEYRSHIPNVTFFEDVLPVLMILRKRGVKLGMISDGYAVTQQNKIAVLQAEQLFDHIILTDTLGRDYWKPDKRAFIIMKEALGLDFSEMIYVGDNPKKDFYIGKDYPILTVRIVRGNGVYLDRPYLGGIKEKMRINSLEELLPLTEGKDGEGFRTCKS